MPSYHHLRLWAAWTEDMGNVKVEAKCRSDARQKIIALLTRKIRGIPGKRIGRIGKIEETW